MTIAKASFGRTKHLSTRTLFGAAALGNVTQAEADQTLDVLLKYGINHIDTAASYGESEKRIGPWMQRGLRDQFFLATKTGKRTYREAREEFLHSLERLKVDSVDLIQLHYLVGEEEWDIAMSEGGALQYLLEAKAQGLVKYIGVTGHDVAIVKMHQKSLTHYDFDSVLLPFNYVMMKNPVYAEGFNEVLRLSRERDFAVQTIKAITRRPYPTERHSHATWYEPLSDVDSIKKAVHWVLGQESIFLNTPGDIHILPTVLEAASNFEHRTADDVMEEMVTRLAMEPLFV
jgi:predicted aldo/keto reductase-like oxidoreductase